MGYIAWCNILNIVIDIFEIHVSIISNLFFFIIMYLFLFNDFLKNEI
jgi:hypothetical protein